MNFLENKEVLSYLYTTQITQYTYVLKIKTYKTDFSNSKLTCIFYNDKEEQLKWEDFDADLLCSLMPLVKPIGEIKETALKRLREHDKVLILNITEDVE